MTNAGVSVCVCVYQSENVLDEASVIPLGRGSSPYLWNPCQKIAQTAALACIVEKWPAGESHPAGLTADEGKRAGGGGGGMMGGAQIVATRLGVMKSMLNMQQENGVTNSRAGPIRCASVICELQRWLSCLVSADTYCATAFQLSPTSSGWRQNHAFSSPASCRSQDVWNLLPSCG